VEANILNTTHPGIEEINDALFSSQRLAGIGTLAASLAHELTNPLSIITATCNNIESIALDGEITLQELQHHLDMIEQSAWRCTHLVQTLRHYSHLDGEEEIDCDLNQIIEDSLTLVSYQFERERSIRITTDLSPDMPYVHCDRNQITQVLINLLTNSQDAIPKNGGMIWIESWFDKSENVNGFSIKDNGSGIAPAIEDRIFEPFFTTKSPNKGTGLGLAIAARIIEQYDGKIIMVNNLDGGAILRSCCQRIDDLQLSILSPSGNKFLACYLILSQVVPNSTLFLKFPGRFRLRYRFIEKCQEVAVKARIAR
jgi:signal transduction histidine kinase